MLLCYYAILHLSIAWDNFLFLYQKHLPQKEVFCHARKWRAECAVSPTLSGLPLGRRACAP